MYPKDTEKWKQFTTATSEFEVLLTLFCIPKILKNESNSQLCMCLYLVCCCCFVSQRYWKMKAIHNYGFYTYINYIVVLYPKDTEKWKQFTTVLKYINYIEMLFCIPKILKNESNSQPQGYSQLKQTRCFVSQRYWKMKAIHNYFLSRSQPPFVVLYPKDTEKWKQFTTDSGFMWKL